MHYTIRSFALFATLSLVATGANAGGGTTSFRPGAVYTSTNDPQANEVAVFTRDNDGALTSVDFVPTGGLGTGAGLGNQAAVRLSENEEFLFVVNAGSNQISVFRVLENGLDLVTVRNSEGVRPVSIDEKDGTVYVVHAGSDSIAGFRLTSDGKLRFIPGSIQPLSSTGTAPAQVEFSPNGRFLFVTEKATNIIARFALDRFGRPRDIDYLPSAGQTPFGFDFGNRNQLIVSEAFGGADGAGTVTSYRVRPNGFLTTLTTRAATNQTASCWIVLTPDGRIAYTSNTMSDTITAFEVSFTGQLIEIGEVANTGAGPTDMALTADGRFLYVLDTQAGLVGDYVVESDGGLTGIPGSIVTLPNFASGLAAR